MPITEERQAPFEIVKIYRQKIIANQAKAALKRINRENVVRENDKPVFARLYSLLNEATIGDRSISSTQIRATSGSSLKILAQSLQAMQGKIAQNTSAFRSRLIELTEASRQLSEGIVSDQDARNNLYDFCKRFGDIQDQILKQPNMKPSYGITVWPFAKRNKYI